VTLALAIFKFDRMEWAIEKCTELGVARIIPVIARRTESHFATAAAKRVDRWRKIALQATEQSRRISPPEIAAPVKTKHAVALPGSLRILLSEIEPNTMLRDVLQGHPNRNDVVLAVGPEGGWAADESKIFEEAGWRPASLGNTILRAETAAIAAIAVVLAELQP
jgi:16S rRNA (uracil1498-N3)-methyltransferase